MDISSFATRRGKAVDLEQALSQAIEAGQYQPESAIPSVRELAKAHGVHYNTVQTVIKRLAAKGLVTSIKRRGVFVSSRGAAPLSTAQTSPAAGLSRRFVGALGIMCIEFLTTDPFNNDDRPLVRMLERFAAETGRAVFRYYLNAESLANPAALVEKCLADQVGGVVIIGMRDTEPLGPILHPLRNRQIPVVVCPLGRQSIAANLHVPIVNSDDRLAGVVAAQHLYDLGHRDLALVTYEGPRPYIDQRVAGFKAVCQLHGLKCTPDQIIELPVKEMSEPEHMRVGAEAFPMLPASTTGVFCMNDRVAAGLIDAAIVAGHQIGKTLSIVGHDNNLRYEDRQITTVIAPLPQIAKRACDLLQAAAGSSDPDGEHFILRPQLLWRRSSGPRLQIERAATDFVGIGVDAHQSHL